MKTFIIFLIIVSNLIFQSTFLQYASIWGVIPNTSLIIIVSFALIKGRKTGATLGLIIGLLQDIIFCDVIGIHALIYFAIGYTVGLTDQKIFRENLIIPIIFTWISTFAFHTFYYLFMYFLSADIPYLLMIRKVFVVEAIYNSIISIPIYKNILKLYKEHTISFIKR